MKFLFWMGSLILFMASCQPNEPSVQSQIVGEWTIIEAKRNNRATQTLKDAFFAFTEEDGMTTNILGDTTNYAYIVEDNAITQLSENDITYNIDRLVEDTLYLTSRIRNYHFEFVAVRKKR